MQKMIESEGGKTDFSFVNSKFNSFHDMINLAYNTLDELTALEKHLYQQEYLANDSKIYEKLNLAKENFNAERYEQTLELVDEIYLDLSELNAFNIKVKTAYELTSRNIKTFFEKNWKIFVIIFVSIYILYLLLRKRVVCYILKRKINLLELRRDSVKSLIIKIQKEYFQKKTLGELTYTIRIRKYAELTRDINRQISVFKEELAFKQSVSLLNNKKNNKKLK
jgi:hypothetical protein